MMTIKETKVTKTFKEEANPYVLDGNFVYTETINEAGEKENTLKTFNVNIKNPEEKNSPRDYKGNAYLDEDNLRYNFSDVDPVEVGEIAAVCEAAFAEAKAMIA